MVASFEAFRISICQGKIYDFVRKRIDHKNVKQKTAYRYLNLKKIACKSLKKSAIEFPVVFSEQTTLFSAALQCCNLENRNSVVSFRNSKMCTAITMLSRAETNERTCRIGHRTIACGRTYGQVVIKQRI